MFYSSFPSTWYSHSRSILVSWVGEGHICLSSFFPPPTPCALLQGYWVGQKVHLGFSMASYRETQTTHLASPVVFLPPFVFYLWTFFDAFHLLWLFLPFVFSFILILVRSGRSICVFDLLYLTGITATNNSLHVGSIQFSLTLCGPMDCSTQGVPIHHQPRAYSSSCPLHWWLVFPNESVLCIRWPKYWSFSFSISPSNEYSGLISFRMVWLDLLAVQGTLKSFLQYHSSKTSILWHSAFFIVQLSHLYLTTGKTIALTKQIFVGKVMNVSAF